MNTSPVAISNVQTIDVANAQSGNDLAVGGEGVNFAAILEEIDASLFIPNQEVSDLSQDPLAQEMMAAATMQQPILNDNNLEQNFAANNDFATAEFNNLVESNLSNELSNLEANSKRFDVLFEQEEMGEFQVADLEPENTPVSYEDMGATNNQQTSLTDTDTVNQVVDSQKNQMASDLSLMTSGRNKDLNSASELDHQDQTSLRTLAEKVEQKSQFDSSKKEFSNNDDFKQSDRAEFNDATKYEMTNEDNLGQNNFATHLQNVKENSVVSSVQNPGSLQNMQDASPVEQVRFSITNAIQEGKHNITIKLHPEELGRVEVRLNFDKNGNNITIATEQAKTLEIMQKNFHSLEASLSELGIQLESSSINLGLSDSQADGTQQEAKDHQFAQNNNDNAQEAEQLIRNYYYEDDGHKIDVRV